jgi:cell wall-associated NlpC family hydrolase
MSWRDEVIANAQGYLGLPYIPRCLEASLGLDCGTLIWHSFKDIISLPPFPADYPSDWALHNEDTRYTDWIDPYVVRVPRPIRGGISVYKYGRSFSHGVIVLDRQNVIHAWGRQKFGCVQRSHVNFFRYPNTERRPVIHYDLKPELQPCHQ